MGLKKKILVTGASGFVGSAIVRELELSGNFEISCLVGRLSGGERESQNERTKFFRGNIADYQSLEKLEELEEIDFLIHTAGLAHQFGQTSKEDFWQVNVRGTENICRLAERLKVRHLILISSVSVYGDHGKAEISETFDCQPSGFYAESKFESEKSADEICRKNKMRLTILRLGTVIGEGDRGNVARLITLIDKGRFLWVGDGSNKKSLIYKNDAAKGVLKVIEAENTEYTKAEIYNLTAPPVTMREVVEAIFVNLGKKTPRFKIPAEIIRKGFRLNERTVSLKLIGKIGRTFEKWLSDDNFSNRRFSEAYNFAVETPISEAIAREVKSYSEQKNRQKKT